MKLLPAILASSLFALIPVAAHHSFDAEYDAKKPIVITGKVTKVDWMNPHIFIHIEGTDDKGVKGTWSCEGGNPNSLRRNGWVKTTVQVGDALIIEGSRAKDGSNLCNARAVKLANGQRILAGSSGGDKAPE
jgi:hypothetical protein